MTAELKSQCIADCLRDHYSKTCAYCAEENGHKCSYCGDEIKEDQCHKHDGVCADCVSADDFFSKFGKG